ncbi:hypothetical protein JOE11_005414 [Robbsia andropogonis]|uniref:metallophosphoesterase family protein n=1 Tax=Robbsia andropogonis TaxID=28092 RepID=UPI003D220678
MISILHLSDLHRAADDPISNDELLVALSTDRARYTRSPVPIKAPEAIVVSGDIIQGVGLGHPDPINELNAQYEVAEQFLAMLVDEFLGGDRSQLVIAPGNHDVDWNVARSAMAAVPEGEVVRPADAMRIGSQLRWCWKERRFFRIENLSLYNQRFNSYWGFVERFYSGMRGLPKVSRTEPYLLFSLAGGRVGVAAFNSCHWNDCYAFHGAIDRPAIAAAHRQMRDLPFQLWMAVWHHSVHGIPYRNDYMDIDQVQDMVGYGFRLGLHGHQHKHQVIPAQVHLPERETMAVVSAGSLCAGAKELPTGYFRQYNIVELSDDLLGARVHVRQMETAHLFSPSHMTAAGGKTFVDVTWSQPLTRPMASSSGASTVLEAERLLRTGLEREAALMLAPKFSEIERYGRSIYVSAAVKAQLWDDLAEKLAQPESIDEFFALVEALDRLRKSSDALKAINDYAGNLGVSESQQRELIQRIKARGGLPR